MRTLAILLLGSLAACGGERLSAEMDGGQDRVTDLSDPGEAAVFDEVRRLPFKHVEWDYKFETHRITRMTQAGDQLFLETPDNRVIAVDRFKGVTQWKFKIFSDTPLDWPPVVAEGVPERKRELEADLVAMHRKIEDKTKEVGPGKETQDLQKKRNEIRELLRAEAYGDNVYFISRHVMYCVDRLSGKLIWTHRLGFIPSARPYAIRNYVFVSGADLARVWALEVENKGSEKTFYKAHIFHRENQVLNRPIYFSPSLFFVSHDGMVYSYHVDSGSRNWEYQTERELKADPIVFVYRHDEESGAAAPAGAPKPAGGMEAPKAGGMEAPKPAAMGAMGAMGAKDDGKKKTGKAIRETSFLFVGGTDNTFYALDANSGGIIWKYECASPIKTPAIARDQTVYVKTEEGALHAFEVNPQHRDPKTNAPLGPKRNGNLRWKIPLGERFLFKGKERIYVIGPKNEIYAMKEMSGEIVGRYKTEFLQHIVSNAADEYVYVANAGGHVFCLKESQQRY